MIALQVLALAAFLLVPGWLAASLLNGGGRTLDGKERVFLAACLGTGIAAACALALSLASAYGTAALLALVGSLCVVLAVAARRRVAWPLRLGGRDLLLSLAVIAVALAIFSPPGRLVFGWADVGVYADVAAHINREGGESFSDPVVKEVAPQRRGVLYEPNGDHGLPYKAMETKGFYITDFETGRVVSQFYYLWPSLMAVFATFLGIGRMFWAVTAMGVLSLWGVFLLARRLLGWRWAAAAAVLAGLCPLFLYFARYATSEMMNMALFLAAFLCAAAYLEADAAADGSGGADARRLAVCSAFLLSLGLLCRVDFTLIVFPLALCYLGKGLLRGLSAADRWFGGLTLAGAALSLLFGAVFSAPYFRTVIRSYEPALGWLFRSPGILALAALLLLCAGAGRLRRRFRLEEKAAGPRLRALLLVLPWVLLGAFLVYVYFVRPRGEVGLSAYGTINAVVGPSFKNYALVRWAWYLSFAGVAAVYAGYALWFTLRRDFKDLLIAAVGVTFTLTYSWDLRHTPLHILAMRRLVPVILPMAAIVVAFLLRSLAEGSLPLRRGRRWTGWAGKAAAAALFLYLALYFTYVSIPIMGLGEGGNQLEICGEIAGKAEEGAVVLMDYHMGDLYGAPLRCFQGVENAWLMDNAALQEDGFPALLQDLGYPERPVYLLWRPSISGYWIPLAGDLENEEVAAFPFREEELERSFTSRPGRRVVASEEIILYRLKD